MPKPFQYLLFYELKKRRKKLKGTEDLHFVAMDLPIICPVCLSITVRRPPGAVLGALNLVADLQGL
jgi:hypothetical protein